MRPLAAVLTLLLASSCGAAETTIHAANQDVTATASRLRVHHLRGFDYVFGYLTIRGSSRTLLTADLDCFSLHVGSSNSESIWVDSLIDTLPGDYPAVDGKVSVAVYWAMKDFKAATDKDLAGTTLSIDKRYRGSCFGFR
jgi:hypothetical protein